MSVHRVVEKQGIYFITFTCHDWLPLIKVSDGYSAVYHFFEVLKKKSHAVAGYVIMPNHVHMLLHYTGTEKNLNTLVGNGKRFMAYEMLRAMEKRGEQALLQKLEHEVQLFPDGSPASTPPVLKDCPAGTRRYCDDSAPSPFRSKRYAYKTHGTAPAASLPTVHLCF